MSAATYVLGIVASLIALGTVVELLRRRRLRERHAFWWLLAALVALIISVFPAILTWLAQLLHVSVPTNLVFFASVVVLFLVNLQASGELTSLEDKTRSLAEETALLKIRLESLERAADRPAEGGSLPDETEGPAQP